MKLDRQKVYERFHIDAKFKDAFNRLMDKYEQVTRNHMMVFTDFLNPETVAALMPVITSFQDIQYKITGGYIRAEYKIVILYPDYLYVEDSDVPLKVVRMTPKDKGLEITHRDVLGSVLSVGIRREKTGDILMHEGFYQMVVLDGMDSIIQSQLDRIRKTTIDVSVEAMDQLIPVDEACDELVTVVASERMDAILAGVWHVSRSKAADLIRSEKVKVNYQPVTSVGMALKTGDMVSCRGKGRFYYDGLLSTTRKDRIRIKVRIIK